MSRRATVYDLSQTEFFEELDDMEINPEDVFKNAPRIYEYMAELFGEECDDSILREQIFQWWSESTELPYSMIYDEWLKSF